MSQSPRVEPPHWIRSSILFLYHALFIIVPLTWTSATSELFEFPKMMLVYGFTLIIVSLWALLMITEQRIIWKRTPFDIPLLLLVLTHGISTMISIDMHTSLWGYYSRFHGGFISTISYILLFYAAVSVLHKNHVKKLMITLLIGASLGSLYAFPEHFGHSPSCAMITNQFDAHCWIQDVQNRVFGTFGQPNWLAAYLISVLFIPLSLLWRDYTASKQALNTKPLGFLYQPRTLLHLLTLGLFFSVLLFTKSRSGFLGFGLGLGLLGLLQLSNPKARSVLASIGLATLTLFAGLYLLFGKGAIPKLDQALSSYTEDHLAKTTEAAEPIVQPSGTQLDSGGTESGEIRRIVWKGALSSWLHHPIFGTGVETFAYSYYNVRPLAHNLVSEWDFLYNKAHNEFLNELATAGAAGLISLLSFMAVYSLWVLRQLMHATVDETTRAYLGAMLAGFWALAVSNFFGFSTVPVGLLFFLFPAWSYLLASQMETTQFEKQTSMTTFQYIGIAVLAVCFIVGAVTLLSQYTADLYYAKGKQSLNAGNLQVALPQLERATQLNPREGVYAEQLSLGLAQAAASLSLSGQATAGAEMAEQAIAWSDMSIKLNKVHLNFYKSRARVYIYLSQIEPKMVIEALQSLIKAASLAPNDPKIAYNIGLLYQQLGETETARSIFEATIEMKPNYEDVRLALGDLYVALEEPDLAREQYVYILTNLKPDSPPVIERLGTLDAKTAN